MPRKITNDAFDYYVSLGPSRNYETVAARYKVTKRAITKHASRGQWQTRVLDLERSAQRVADKKTVETMSEVHERRRKVLNLVLTRGLEALKQPLKTAVDGLRAVDLALKYSHEMLPPESNSAHQNGSQEMCTYSPEEIQKLVSAGGRIDLSQIPIDKLRVLVQETREITLQRESRDPLDAPAYPNGQ